MMVSNESQRKATGHWVEIEHPEVVTEIKKIEKEIANYNGIMSDINNLIAKIGESNSYLSKVHGVATGALSINNSGFNVSMGNVKTLSTNMNKSVGNLSGSVSEIKQEIRKLELKKAELEKKKVTTECIVNHYDS